MIEDTREPEYTKDDACEHCHGDGFGPFVRFNGVPKFGCCPECNGTGIEPTRPFHIPHDPERGDYFERD